MRLAVFRKLVSTSFHLQLMQMQLMLVICLYHGEAQALDRVLM
jgi:hypothetical protein